MSKKIDLIKFQMVIVTDTCSEFTLLNNFFNDFPTLEFHKSNTIMTFQLFIHCFIHSREIIDEKLIFSNRKTLKIDKNRINSLF